MVTIDAFHSETVNYSDLVLPDATYLERHDVISLLDRPISDASAACDAVRVPILPCRRGVRPWQEVMLELAARLNMPEFVGEDGTPKYRDYADFIIRYEARPGVGFLSGWRGGDDSPVRGEANPEQWKKYERKTPVFTAPNCRRRRAICALANRDYMRFAKAAGWLERDDAPMTIELYSELLRKFQLAGEGFGTRLPPREEQRRRLRLHCDPLPYWTAADSVAAAGGYCRISVFGNNPAADVYVSFLGFAKRLAAANRRPQSAVYSARARRGGWESRTAMRCGYSRRAPKSPPAPN